MKKQKINVKFHFLNSNYFLKDRNRLKNFISLLFISETISLERLDFIFCSDAYLLQMNQDFLKHDYYTDVITFQLSPFKAPIVGEVYISTDRVKENASTLSLPFQTELHRVIFHGALHLCGYKDKSEAAKKHMREKEDFYLHQYLVPRGTI